MPIFLAEINALKILSSLSINRYFFSCIISILHQILAINYTQSIHAQHSTSFTSPFYQEIKL